MSFDLTALTTAVAKYGTVARIVVIRSAGSTPRGPGTSMLVWSNGQDGTIGGGALEFQATTDARAVLASGQNRRVNVPLGPTLGQCCGGAVTLVTEVFSAETLPTKLPYARSLNAVANIPPKVSRRLDSPIFAPIEIDGWLIEGAPPTGRQLWIYGAGHVGRALVHVMAPLPDLAITWIDIEATRFPAKIPTGVTQLIAQYPSLAAKNAPDWADHLILTHAHDLDLALCHAILDRNFGSVGLIGSATKWARFRSRLAALGHAPEQINRIICPIGDPTFGKHPNALALGVATAFLSQNIAATQDLTG